MIISYKFAYNYIFLSSLPEPQIPNHRLFMPVLVDSFVIAIVIYAISFSMAKIFSNKHGYPVDATQELYAGVRLTTTKCWAQKVQIY